MKERQKTVRDKFMDITSIMQECAGLLPLSNLSNASINGVTVQGGIYTACSVNGSSGGIRLYDLI